MIWVTLVRTVVCLVLMVTGSDARSDNIGTNEPRPCKLFTRGQLILKLYNVLILSVRITGHDLTRPVRPVMVTI